MHINVNWIPTGFGWFVGQRRSKQGEDVGGSEAKCCDWGLGS